MIQASELRLDNWVNLTVSNSIETASFYGKVDSIHRDHIRVGDGVKADLEFIFPIELSTDILEKAGFIKVSGNDIDYYGPGGLTVSKFGRVERNGYCIVNEVKYLHRFQNLFFELTGEELTINL